MALEILEEDKSLPSQGLVVEEDNEFYASPTETFLSSMAPTRIAAGVYGLKEAAPQLFSGDFSGAQETLGREYNSAKEVLGGAKKENPRAAMLGSMAPYLVAPASIPAAATVGGVSSALDTRADLSNITEPEEYKKLGQDVLVGTGLGAGFGTLVKFAPKSTAAMGAGALAGEMIAPGEGALPGAAVGLAARGAMSPAVRNYLTKKFGSVALGVPEEHADKYLKNRDAVNNAMSKEALGQKIADTFGDVKEDISTLSKGAQSSLRSTPVQGSNSLDIVSKLRSLKDSQANALADELESAYLSRIQSVDAPRNPEQLSELDMHRVKAMFQRLGFYGSSTPPADVAKINMMAGEANAALRGQNEQYVQQMDPLAQKTRLKNELAKRFGIKPDYSVPGEQRFQPSDTTINAINDVARGRKIDRKNILSGLKEQGYGDIQSDIENTAAKTFFEGSGSPQGSRRAVTFGAVGGAVGAATGIPGAGWFGTALGTTTGATIDKYGPQIGKKMLDAATAINKLQSSAAGSKYLQPLMNAAKRGTQSYAATYYLMSQAEPEFRQIMDADETNR